MTQALDAATAACRIVLEIHHKRTAEDFARAALRAALPAEPRPADLEAMIEAYGDGRRDPNATVRDIFAKAYSGLRAQILGDEA